MMTTIRNTADLLNVYGEGSDNNPEEDERRLDRRVYKSTACGAWAKLLPPGYQRVGTRRGTWTVRITNSIVGPKCYNVRRKGRRAIVTADAPEYVRQFLLPTETLPEPHRKGFDPHTMHNITWEQLVDLPIEGGIERVTKRRGALLVTFTLDEPVLKPHQGGVLLGSIVEGSDAEIPARELLFPFTEEALDKVLEGIEDEVDFFWRRDNLDPDDPEWPGESYY